MADDPQQLLKDIKQEKEFFIGIDSDGCVFDTMEIKQKECFCPNFIKYWNLQIISRYARETWEFVNLYSKTRGYNRFIALTKTIALLKERKEVSTRNIKLPDMKPIIEWTKKESKLGNPALEKYTSTINEPILNRALNWSKAVNEDIKELVKGIPPFSYVKESLEKIIKNADSIVVSQTPVEALTREWEENDLEKFVRFIAGQEYGTKAEHIALGAKGKYPDNKILVIGDAYGDHKAAKSNEVLFYPVNPGHEEESWERFYKEALDKFFNGTYKGDYEKSLIDEFDTYLPELPPWK